MVRDSAIGAQERVVVSLDVEDLKQARAIIDRLGSDGCIYKIGLQLLTAEGPAIIRELVASGKKVFLDLKLFEIPHSVAGAVTAAGRLGVSMMTVHASGGSKILESAVEAARPFPDLRVLALTVVTSLRDNDLRETGVNASVEEQVARLARLADLAGCHGVVASPQEIRLLRSTIGREMLILAPGALVSNKASPDQARTATVFETIKAGATHVMLGRAITQAGDCKPIFDQVCQEISSAME